MEANPEIDLRFRDGSRKTLIAPSGSSLRDVLLENGFPPYVGKHLLVNCRGLGICGSCKVNVLEDGEWWERRACQLRVFSPLVVGLRSR